MKRNKKAASAESALGKQMRSKFRALKPHERSTNIVGWLDKDATRHAYEDGKNLSRFLESLDPTTAYGDQRVSGDAFQRALKSCGIRLTSNLEAGIPASTLEDVVEHPKARYLAIELIARAYRSVIHKRAPAIMSTQGLPGSMINQYAYAGPRGIPLEPAIPLSELVGQTTGINQKYYKPFYIQDVTRATARVGEGAEIPAVKIATSENLINLYKYGRRIDVTYEALRSIPIDLLADKVRRIAIKVETEKVEKALDVIVNGDGNAGTAATVYQVSVLNGATAGNTFTLEAWLAFKMKFKNPFMLTTVIGQDASILQLMLMNTGSANIPLIMMGAIAGTQTFTPINQTLAGGERVGWLDAAPANKLVGIDKRFALERVFEIGANIQESDRDVKHQINSLVLSEVEGYAIMEGGNANKILDLAS
jgi:hypothetical protein